MHKHVFNDGVHGGLHEECTEEGCSMFLITQANSYRACKALYEADCHYFKKTYDMTALAHGYSIVQDEPSKCRIDSLFEKLVFTQNPSFIHGDVNAICDSIERIMYKTPVQNRTSIVKYCHLLYPLSTEATKCLHLYSKLLEKPLSLFKEVNTTYEKVLRAAVTNTLHGLIKSGNGEDGTRYSWPYMASFRRLEQFVEVFDGVSDECHALCMTYKLRWVELDTERITMIPETRKDVYCSIVDQLRGPINILGRTVGGLVTLLEQTKSGGIGALWRFIENMRPECLREIYGKLSRHVKSRLCTVDAEMVVDAFRTSSPMHTEIFEMITKDLEYRKKNSVYHDFVTVERRRVIAVMDQFAEFIETKYNINFNPSSLVDVTGDHIKEFIRNAHSEATPVSNDMIRGAVSVHSVKFIYIKKFYPIKYYLHPYLSPDIVLPTVNDCINGVDTKYDPVNRDKRVYLVPDEMKVVEDYISKNSDELPPWTKLLFYILRDVALRAYALTTLRYVDLYDFHQGNAKHILTIREKHNQIRRVVPTMDIRVEVSKMIDRSPRQPNQYIFSTSTPNANAKPLSNAQLNEFLRKIVYGSGIKDIRIYAHMFRYSLVSNMLSVGNKLTKIADHMGHKKSDTTYTYYTRTTITDLFTQVKNPFLENYVKQKTTDEQECDLYKLIVLVKLVKAYEEAIKMFKGRPVADLHEYIAKNPSVFPNSASLLVYVRDCMSSSTIQ